MTHSLRSLAACALLAAAAGAQDAPRRKIGRAHV